MIEADIHGKTGVPEDVLTSNCFGLLELLQDDYLIELLALSCRVDKRKLDLKGLETVEKLEYWPWLRDGGSPDVIATLTDNSHLRRVRIVIEVKHGAGKSGGSGDQLVRYYKAAKQQYQTDEVFLLYLTHHREMPNDDLKASLADLPQDASIYWLSWYTVSKWAWDNHKKSQKTQSLVESRITEALCDYLQWKGYKRFHEMSAVLCSPITSPVYSRGYFRNDLAYQFKSIQIYIHQYIQQQWHSDDIRISEGFLLPEQAGIQSSDLISKFIYSRGWFSEFPKSRNAYYLLYKRPYIKYPAPSSNLTLYKQRGVLNELYSIS